MLELKGGRICALSHHASNPEFKSEKSKFTMFVSLELGETKLLAQDNRPREIKKIRLTLDHYDTFKRPRNGYLSSNLRIVGILYKKKFSRCKKMSLVMLCINSMPTLSRRGIQVRRLDYSWPKFETSTSKRWQHTCSAKDQLLQIEIHKLVMKAEP
jgi:hypothetical protein